MVRTHSFRKHILTQVATYLLLSDPTADNRPRTAAAGHPRPNNNSQYVTCVYFFSPTAIASIYFSYSEAFPEWNAVRVE